MRIRTVCCVSGCRIRVCKRNPTTRFEKNNTAKNDENGDAACRGKPRQCEKNRLFGGIGRANYCCTDKVTTASAAALCGCDGNAPKAVYFPEISNRWKFIREML